MYLIPLIIVLESYFAEDEMLRRVNQIRAANKVSSLCLSKDAFMVAKQHNDWQLSKETISHEQDGEKYVDRMKKSGVKWNTCGENVGVTYDANAKTNGVKTAKNAKIISEHFVKSLEHFQNLVNPEYNKFGWDVKCKEGACYWTQSFLKNDLNCDDVKDLSIPKTDDTDSDKQKELKVLTNSQYKA